MRSGQISIPLITDAVPVGGPEEGIKSVRVVRRRPAAVLAATVLAMGALSACGGDGEGGSSSSSTTATPRSVESSSSSSSSSSSASSASSSSSGSSDAPDVPEAATKHTQDGAVAFAKYYWESTGVALEESDTALLQELVSKDCTVCQSLIEEIDKNKAKGIHADRNPTTVSSAKIASTTNGKSDEAVRLEITDGEHNFVKDDEVLGHVKAAEFTGIVYTDWEDGAWVVVDAYIIT